MLTLIVHEVEQESPILETNLIGTPKFIHMIPHPCILANDFRSVIDRRMI